jgi:hypothetical protein
MSCVDEEGEHHLARNQLCHLDNSADDPVIPSAFDHAVESSTDVESSWNNNGQRVSL